MTAELEQLNKRWNVALRSPWQSETEAWDRWELRLIPRESTWSDYPTFAASTPNGVVQMAAQWDNNRQQ